jgi:HSP20 family protein
MRVTDLIPWSRGRRDIAAAPGGDSMERFGVLQSDINRAFEEFWRRFEAPMVAGRPPDIAGAGIPPVDIRETDKALEVRAELPGMDEGDVDVSIADGALIIRGEKRSERARESEAFTLRECSFGRVERVIPLPDGLDLDSAQADFRNGVLNVAIPKTTQTQSSAKRIPVKQQ